MNLVSILHAVVSAVQVPFQGERGKRDGGYFMVAPLGLPEHDSVVEFPCLHDSFQSWVLCGAAEVVSGMCMFIIYIKCFHYSRAAMTAGLCCAVAGHSVQHYGVYWEVPFSKEFI